MDQSLTPHCSLIAIMLGRLEMDVNECITEYKTLMRTVFEKKEGLGPVFLNGIIKPRFSSKLLEDVIKRVIKNVNSARAKRPGQKLIPINEPLYLESQKGGPRRCRVSVAAYSQSRIHRLMYKPALFVHRERKLAASLC